MSRAEANRRRAAHRRHASQRARERYGVQVSRKDYKRMLREVAVGEAPEIERRSVHVRVHLIRHRELTLLGLYDAQLRAITTFLPRRC